jgi:hypothetical protein
MTRSGFMAPGEGGDGRPISHFIVITVQNTTGQAKTFCGDSLALPPNAAGARERFLNAWQFAAEQLNPGSADPMSETIVIEYHAEKV